MKILANDVLARLGPKKHSLSVCSRFSALLKPFKARAPPSPRPVLRVVPRVVPGAGRSAWREFAGGRMRFPRAVQHSARESLKSRFRERLSRHRVPAYRSKAIFLP